MPSLEIANNVICAQLSQMIKVVTLLQNGREDSVYGSPDIVAVALSLIKDFTFITVKDGDLYNTTFFKSDNYDEQYGSLPLTCKCERQPITPDNDMNVHQVATKNLDMLLCFYGQVLVAYYNSLCSSNEPTFGEPFRQIPFAPPGATQNQAFWNIYKYQFITSINSFARLISIPYSVYICPISIRCTAFMMYDMVKFEFALYYTENPPKYIEP